MLFEYSKIVVIFETFIENKESNELQRKVIFSYRIFSNKKLCGFLDLKVNKGKAFSKKIQKNNRNLCHV
jgi:hypothetical protein